MKPEIKFRRARKNSLICNVGKRYTVRISPPAEGMEVSIHVEINGATVLALTRANARLLAKTLDAALQEKELT